MPLLNNAMKAGGFSSGGGGGNYLSLKAIDGKNKTRFTILGDESLAGYECWVDGPNGKGMPIRFADEPSPSDIEHRCSELKAQVRGPEHNNPTTSKRFMAFAVWNYNASTDDKGNDVGKVQVLQFTQAGIGTPLIAYLSDEEIEAEPSTFDFVLSATVGAMPQDKRFQVAALPGRRRKPEVNAEIEESWDDAVATGFNLQRLLTNGDPFKAL